MSAESGALPAIRALIFDIGRVIIRLDIKRAMDGLSVRSAASPEVVWQSIQDDPLWREWQEGRIASRDWHQYLSRRLGLILGYEEFCSIWNRALDPITLLPDWLFADLSQRYTLALLSNTDPIHVAYMESNFDFIRAFPVRIYSCAVGATKPCPAIFQRALEACSLTASEGFFIDDIQPFVVAAREFGLRGLQFLSADQLLADFRALGIL
ncbi:MAG TPA: HAD family hydrolase [Candidatus Dormibacteraeota bacterium]|nr:HAD family hydrolase [Candidatus Dormibacteraeota bacterium]